MALYENIKKLCKEKSITIIQLEEELNFSRSSICKWNNNLPSIAKVKAVADYFDVTIDKLLHE